MFNESGGSIQYRNGYGFDMFHHQSFSYDPFDKRLKFNRNPYGDPVLVDISQLACTEDGFSILLSDRKRPVKFRDRSNLERVLTQFLLKWCTCLHLDGVDSCGFDLEYSEQLIQTLDCVSYDRGVSSDSMTLLNEEGRMVYLDRRDYSRVPVGSILLHEKDLILQKEGGSLIFECHLDVQDNIFDLLKAILAVALPSGTVVRI